MNREQIRERMRQAKLIMKEIGPLMDAMEAIPNDTIGAVNYLAPELFVYLRRIAYICEFGESRDGDGIEKDSQSDAKGNA